MIVRPIEDVAKDIQAKIIKMLPGSQAVRGVWAAFCEAHRMHEHARAVLGEEDVSERRQWLSHGEMYASATIIRKIADELKIPNTTC